MFYSTGPLEEELQESFECLICENQKSKGYQVQKDIFIYCQLLFSKKLKKEEGSICHDCVLNYSPKLVNKRIEMLKYGDEIIFKNDERIDSLTEEAVRRILHECLTESLDSKELMKVVQKEMKNEILRFQQEKIENIFVEREISLENLILFRQTEKLQILNHMMVETWNDLIGILKNLKSFGDNLRHVDILFKIFYKIENLNRKYLQNKENEEFNFWICLDKNFKREILYSIYSLLNTTLKTEDIFQNQKLFQLLLEVDDFHVLKLFYEKNGHLKKFQLFYNQILFDKFKSRQSFEIFNILIETSTNQPEMKKILISHVKSRKLLFQVLVQERNQEEKINFILSKESLGTITKFSKDLVFFCPIWIFKQGSIYLLQLIHSNIQNINSMKLGNEQNHLFFDWIELVQISCGIKKVSLKFSVVLKNGIVLWRNLVTELKTQIEKTLNVVQFEILEKLNDSMIEPIQTIQKIKF
jgi:hypothetical protein